MNWLVFSLVLLPILVALGFFAWKVFNKKVEKVKIFLYERVNNAYFFKKKFTAFLKSDMVLGNYLVSKSNKFRMAEPSIDEFIPSKKYKFLNVAKFGSDDFRPVALLKGNSFYKKISEVVTNKKEVLNPDGETVLVDMPVLDRDNKPVTKIVEKPYEEPMAVTQSDKEVIRFNRDYNRRMDELKKSKEGFWKENAPMMISSAIVAICIIGMIIFVRVDSKSDFETSKYWADKFGVKMDEAIGKIENPNFIERIMENIDRQKAEGQAPIS